jgi:hypothetical protein
MTIPAFVKGNQEANFVDKSFRRVIESALASVLQPIYKEIVRVRLAIGMCSLRTLLEWGV